MRSDPLDNTLFDVFAQDTALSRTTAAAFDSAYSEIRRRRSSANEPITDENRAVNYLNKKNPRRPELCAATELAAAAAMLVLAAGILAFALPRLAGRAADATVDNSAPLSETETIPTIGSSFRYTRADGVEVYCFTHDTVAAASQDELDEYECLLHGWKDADELHANVTDENYRDYFTKEFHLKHGHARFSPAPGAISADEAVTTALRFVEKHFPGSAPCGSFVTVYYGYLDDPDRFNGDIWIIEHLESVSEVFVDAMTGEVVFPKAVEP